MTETRNPLSADDWLDGVLAADAAITQSGYIADDGFTTRVLRALPAAPARPSWRRPALAALWGAAAAGAVLAAPGPLLEVVREGYRFLATQPVSLSGLGAAALAMFALSAAAAAYSLRDSD